MIVRLGCLALVVLASLLLAGCKRDAEINAALAELDSFTNELVERIGSAETPVAGVDQAQQYLDSRKREIRGKTTYLARVRGIQVTDETEKRLVETVRRDQMTIVGLATQPKYNSLYMSDAAFRTKLDKLINDYLELFRA